MAYMSPDSNTHANVSIFLTQLSTAPDNQSDSYADNMDINVDPDRSAFDHINESLDLYVKPLMYIFGIVGNLTSFAVFMCTFMRHSSSSIYLAALAISDTVFILCTLIAWSDNFNWRLSHQPIICQLNVFVSYVAGFLSVWYVVGFTIERCLAIQFPLKRQVLCTPRRAKLASILLALLAAALYNFALWTTTAVRQNQDYFCQPIERYFSIVMLLNHVDTIITLVIPTVLIIGGNVHIIYVLTKFYKNRQNANDNFRLHCRAYATPAGTAANAACAGAAGPASNSRSSDDKERAAFVGSVRSTTSARPTCYASNTSFNHSQMKVTRMLLIVSTTFLVLNIPSHTMRLILFYAHLVNDSYVPSRTFRTTLSLTHFLYYANFCVNFLLYAASGRTFRKAFRRLLQRIKRNIQSYCQKTKMAAPKTRLLADHASRQRSNQRTAAVATSRTNSRRDPQYAVPAADTAENARDIQIMTAYN